MKRIITLDVGGTAIKYGILNEKLEFELLDSQLSHGDIIMEQIDELIDMLIKKYPDVKSAAICTTGPVDITKNVVVQSNKPFKNYVNNSFNQFGKKHNLKIYLYNDSKAATLAEIYIGKQTGNFVLLTIGTGIGGGFVYNGKLLLGKRYTSGEFGFMRIGGNDLADHYLSFTKINTILKQKFGFSSKNHEMFSKNYKENKQFKRFFDSYLKKLAQYFYNICVALDLDSLIIGGGFVYISQEAKNTLSRIFYKLLAKTPFQIELKYSQFGNDAGVLGIGAYVFKSEAKLKK